MQTTALGDQVFSLEASSSTGWLLYSVDTRSVKNMVSSSMGASTKEAHRCRGISPSDDIDFLLVVTSKMMRKGDQSQTVAVLMKYKD